MKVMSPNSYYDDFCWLPYSQGGIKKILGLILSIALSVLITRL